MGKSQRRKGHNWEREVAKRLRNLGLDARRNVTETQTGNTGDVHVCDAQGDMLMCVQCKNMKSPSIWKAMEEAIEAAESHGIDWPVPVSIVKRTAKAGGPVEEYAVMRLEDWAKFLMSYKFGEPIRRFMEMGPPEQDMDNMN